MNFVYRKYSRVAVINFLLLLIIIIFFYCIIYLFWNLGIKFVRAATANNTTFINFLDISLQAKTFHRFSIVRRTRFSIKPIRANDQCIAKCDVSQSIEILQNLKKNQIRKWSKEKWNVIGECRSCP